MFTLAAFNVQTIPSEIRASTEVRNRRKAEHTKNEKKSTRTNREAQQKRLAGVEFLRFSSI